MAPRLVRDVLRRGGMRRLPPERPHPEDPTREAPWCDDVQNVPFWCLWEFSMIVEGWDPPSGRYIGPDDDRTDAPEPE